jgi:hypothetical protein
VFDLAACSILKYAVNLAVKIIHLNLPRGPGIVAGTAPAYGGVWILRGIENLKLP